MGLKSLFKRFQNFFAPKLEETTKIETLTEITEEPVKVIGKRLAEVAEKKEVKIKPNKKVVVVATDVVAEPVVEEKKKPRRKRKPKAKPKTEE
jgi:hypothetical protein